MTRNLVLLLSWRAVSHWCLATFCFAYLDWRPTCPFLWRAAATTIPGISSKTLSRMADPSHAQLARFNTVEDVLAWAGMAGHFREALQKAWGNAESFWGVVHISRLAWDAAMVFKLQDPASTDQHPLPDLPLSPVQEGRLESFRRACLLKCGQAADTPPKGFGFGSNVPSKLSTPQLPSSRRARGGNRCRAKRQTTNEDKSLWDNNKRLFSKNRRGKEVCELFNVGKCGNDKPQGKCKFLQSHQCNACLGPHRARSESCQGRRPFAMGTMNSVISRDNGLAAASSASPSLQCHEGSSSGTTCSLNDISKSDAEEHGQHKEKHAGKSIKRVYRRTKASKEDEPPLFTAQGPCPKGDEEMRSCVVRFLCGSPDLGYPITITSINDCLRRAYTRAGHSESSLSWFIDQQAADAVRERRSEPIFKIDENAAGLHEVGIKRRKVFRALAMAWQ